MDVVLRPVVAEDLPLLVGGESPFDEFGPQRPRSEPYPPLLREPGGMAICAADDQRPLGNVSWIWQQWGPMPESRNPMIGIWLRTEARGRGAGTAAQRALVDLFFRHTSVHRVEASTDAENIAEQRALEKVGFTREGIARGAQWRDGAFRDLYSYSILRSEWSC